MKSVLFLLLVICWWLAGGWGSSGVNHPCVSQMGKIRDRACAANRSRSKNDDDNAAPNLAGAADEADTAAF